MKWGRGKGTGAGEWVGGWGSFVHHSRSDVGESHHVSRTHARTALALRPYGLLSHDRLTPTIWVFFFLLTAKA